MTESTSYLYRAFHFKTDQILSAFAVSDFLAVQSVSKRHTAVPGVIKSLTVTMLTHRCLTGFSILTNVTFSTKQVLDILKLTPNYGTPCKVKGLQDISITMSVTLSMAIHPVAFEIFYSKPPKSIILVLQRKSQGTTKISRLHALPTLN